MRQSAGSDPCHQQKVYRPRARLLAEVGATSVLCAFMLLPASTVAQSASALAISSAAAHSAAVAPEATPDVDNTAPITSSAAITATAVSASATLVSSAAASSMSGTQVLSNTQSSTSLLPPAPVPAPEPDGSIEILGQVIAPNSYRRLTWSSENLTAGFSEPTPVLVVNGATPGPTLCMVGAVHGDELNGIEMIRSVIFDIDPSKLTGTVIGVPVANIMGFRRNSRYLPDRRDWNRYFPGNTHGSTASRLAHSFFNSVIVHCDALLDIHTGSFHRTNLPQLRADLSDDAVAKLAQQFGDIAVLNSRGNPSSLRAAAVRIGIPAVTMEAGEPQHLQIEVVNAGVAAIKILLAKREMYGRAPKWGRAAPVYYRSSWLRASQSGILFSRVGLGKRVREGEILGVVTDPITNARSNIVSPYHGRVLGMALDQVVLPGFAAYHIGVQTAEQILIEEGLLNEGGGEVDDEDGDDAGVVMPDPTHPPTTPVVLPQGSADAAPNGHLTQDTAASLTTQSEVLSVTDASRAIAAQQSASATAVSAVKAATLTSASAAVDINTASEIDNQNNTEDKAVAVSEVAAIEKSLATARAVGIQGNHQADATSQTPTQMPSISDTAPTPSADDMRVVEVRAAESAAASDDVSGAAQAVAQIKNMDEDAEE